VRSPCVAPLDAPRPVIAEEHLKVGSSDSVATTNARARDLTTLHQHIRQGSSDPQFASDIFNCEQFGHVPCLPCLTAAAKYRTVQVFKIAITK